MIDPTQVYIFISGALVGKFVGIIPSAIISGVLLYVADPNIFKVDNIKLVMNMVKTTNN